MYGKDYEYANSRLIDTIVRLESEPIHVNQVRRDGKVEYYTLADRGEIKTCDLEDLNLKPVPLGYCNYGKMATYLTRMPMRRDWRQGLRRENMTSISGMNSNKIPIHQLHHCIVGDFPTLAGALGALGKVSSIAWHRHWAVNTDNQVTYKGGVVVGSVKDGVVVLNESHQYLKEALAESFHE